MPLAKGADFDPTQKLITKKDYVEKIEKYGEDAGTVEEVKPAEKPEATPEVKRHQPCLQKNQWKNQ